jgi:hypothetical protein
MGSGDAAKEFYTLLRGLFIRILILALDVKNKRASRLGFAFAYVRRLCNGQQGPKEMKEKKRKWDKKHTS